MKKVTIAARINKEKKDKIKEHAEELNMSLSDYIEKALDEKIDAIYSGTYKLERPYKDG